MRVRIWMFLALLTMTMLGVGGASAAHAQEFPDCGLPQTHLRLTPETEKYRDSSHQFGCQAPSSEERVTPESKEPQDDLLGPTQCLLPQTDQDQGPGFSENNGYGLNGRYLADPCLICYGTEDSAGAPCFESCPDEMYIFRDESGELFTDSLLRVPRDMELPLEEFRLPRLCILPSTG